MLTMMIMAGAAAAMPATSKAQTTPPTALPVQVMVLGTYHFGNPGLDKVNVEADDVTSPRRQRELESLARALLAFRPTRVMVEVQRPGPTYDVTDYAGTTAKLATSRDETVQIGYRVATLARLANVQGIDEQPSDGEPDYFPMEPVEAFAKAHDRQGDLDAAFASIRAAARTFEVEQPTTSIPRMLIRYNDPSTPMGGQDLYYSMLRMGDGERQPGADLNAMWYLRNAKIFSKLVDVARPGDRILVVYGAGHGFWLRHFAATMPGYRMVDVRPYLTTAAADAERTRPAAHRAAEKTR